MKILVVAERYMGEIQSITNELISKARNLVDENNGEVITLLVSDDVSDAEKLIHLGSDKVITVKLEEYKNFDSKAHKEILSKVIKKYSPDTVFVGATDNGRDLAARVTAKLHLGLTADCIDITYENGKFNFIRPTFDGKLYSGIICSTKPEFATISSKIFKENEPDTNRKGEIIEENDFQVKYSNFVTVKEIKLDEVLSQSIEYADKIVACGKGIESQDNIKIIEEFANSIGASLAVTKPLVQKGWAPQSIQVGSSGKTVRPKLYIALGISGAKNHTSGMDKSDLIIAVNNDKNAPIFDVAHYGIVGDLFEAIPYLKKKLS